VEQYYALLEDVAVEARWGAGKATVWAEALSARGADVLMRYGTSNGWLEGRAAVLSRSDGKGRMTYIGALPDRALIRAAVEAWARSAGLSLAFGPVPDDVEVCRRSGSGGDVFILINYGKQPRPLLCREPCAMYFRRARLFPQSRYLDTEWLCCGPDDLCQDTSLSRLP
jgi:beta-galactosidase